MGERESGVPGYSFLGAALLAAGGGGQWERNSVGGRGGCVDQ